MKPGIFTRSELERFIEVRRRARREMIAYFVAALVGLLVATLLYGVGYW